MWIIKIKLKDKNCIWATRCRKLNIYDYQYALKTFWKNNYLHIVMAHILEGKEGNIKQYTKDIKTDKRVIKAETKKNFMVTLAKEEKERGLNIFHNPQLIFIKPGINYPDGSEIWEVGSFDRKNLTNLFDVCKKKFGGKLIYFKKSKLDNVFIPHIMPKLTEKQKEAFKSAIENEYYLFPRKTNLIKLSKLMKISRPTFEEHLRKAEIKLLRFMKELVLR